MKKIKIYIAVISGLFCCLFAYSLFSLLAGGTPSPCLGEFESAPVQLKLISSGQVHPGFGVENSLDGDPNDDYTAFYENSRHQFTLEVIPEMKVLNGTINFLDSENYASDWKVEARDKNNQLCASFQKKAATGQKQTFQLSSEKPIKFLLFSFSGFSGQQRLLMRELTFDNPGTVMTSLEFSSARHKQIRLLDVKVNMSVPVPPRSGDKQPFAGLAKNDEINYIYYMGGEFLCKEIKLDFSQSSYIPENITGWTTDGNRKNKYDNIFSISGNSSSKLAIPLNKAFAFMILTTSAFNRNPAVAATMALHPEIDFFLNEQQQKNYLQDQELHKKILIAGNDQRNPLYVFRWPITEYYRHVAAQLLGKDADKLSDFQKVITLMDYICKLRTYQLIIS